VSSDVRSKENSEETEEKYGELKRGDIEDTMCANREEVLCNPIQTAPSQNGFQSPQRSGQAVSISRRCLRDPVPARKKEEHTQGVFSSW